jgi:septal ring factor EnvC (AmiA/AmiB activator)
VFDICHSCCSHVSPRVIDMSSCLIATAAAHICTCPCCHSQALSTKASGVSPRVIDRSSCSIFATAVAHICPSLSRRCCCCHSQALSTKARALVKESKELKARVKDANDAVAAKESAESELRTTVESLKSDIEQLRGEREAIAAARDADAFEDAAAVKRVAALEDTVRARETELTRLGEELGALRQGKADMELRLAEHERGALSLEQEKRDLHGQLDALRSEVRQMQVRAIRDASCNVS